MSTAKVVHRTSVYTSGGASGRDPHRPGLSAMFVLAADIVGLSITLWVFLGNTIIERYSAQSSWLPLWSLLPLFLVAYWFFDSYPGISVSSVDEIRRIVLANTSVFLFVSVMIALHDLAIRPLLLYLCACIRCVRCHTCDAHRSPKTGIAVRLVGLSGCTVRKRNGGAAGVAQTGNSSASWFSSRRSGYRSS